MSADAVQLGSYVRPSVGSDTYERNGALGALKLVCTRRKKESKRHVYLTFVENCSLPAPIEQSQIDVLGKTDSTPILLKHCISCEYFDAVKNDFQAFVYVYFEAYTVSIYFSDAHGQEKERVIKHLEQLREERAETNEPVAAQAFPCQATGEHLVHTFDVKLIPNEPIIARDHALVGLVRLYFTTTDLYIAAVDCTADDLKKTIANQCPPKEKTILCIPYFTIRHYGNRGHIFLIELGKSNYGNGEVQMKCLSPSLASTIHLLASPVIEERPAVLSSAFQNQLITNRRMEKLKKIQPPVEHAHDATNVSVLTRRNTSTETLSADLKSRSVVGFIRKLVRNPGSLRRSKTFNGGRAQQQNSTAPPLLPTQLFEMNMHGRPSVVLDSLPTVASPHEAAVKPPRLCTMPKSSASEESNPSAYLDMGPISQEPKQDRPEEVESVGNGTTDIGVNTTISIPPTVRSAIIVDGTVHLIAAENASFSIGQRSFTFPASVMQPFKAQLNGQAALDTSLLPPGMNTCVANSSSSFHQPASASNSQQSLLVSYGVITFNRASMSADMNECGLSLSSDEAALDRRLYSDLSLMSGSHQQQPANVYSVNSILSSSSSSGSQIFRNLSLTTTGRGETTSVNESTLLFDESAVDRTTSYLLGPAPCVSTNKETISAASLSRLSSASSTRSTSRPHLSYIAEEKSSSSDPYASVEPLPHRKSPLEASVVEYNSSIEEKNEQPSTILYTDGDFPQTQRQDHISPCAVQSKLEDQPAPFVL